MDTSNKVMVQNLKSIIELNKVQNSCALAQLISFDTHTINRCNHCKLHEKDTDWCMAHRYYYSRYRYARQYLK